MSQTVRWYDSIFKVKIAIKSYTVQDFPDYKNVPICQTVLYRAVWSYTVIDFTDQIKNLPFLFLVKVCWFFILHTHAPTLKSSLMATLYHSSEQDSNLGSSRIAVFGDCKATALTTQPPRLDALWRLLYIEIFCQKPSCNFKSVLTGGWRYDTFKNPEVLPFTSTPKKLEFHWSSKM